MNLEAIAGNACTLRERLNASMGPWESSSDYAWSFVREWCGKLPSGGRDVLESRLSLDDWQMNQIIHALSVEPNISDLSTKWTDILETVTKFCPQVIEDITENSWPEIKYCRNSESIIFPELWLPFHRYCRSSILKCANRASGRFAPEAWVCISKQFFIEISQIGSAAAYRQFVTFRKVRSFSEDTFFENSRKIYDAFIRSRLENRLIPLFSEYAVLARQLSKFANSWVTIWSELLIRLNSDVADIAEKMNDGKDIGCVVGIVPDLSDRHNGGRRVVRLEFSSGLSLIYKPRNVDQEFGFNSLLKWLEQNEFESLPRVEVLSRDLYGWESCAEHTECVSEKDVERYYRRAGMLICLVYVLAGSDCHMGNILATSAGPLLVDVETLLQPGKNANSTVLHSGALYRESGLNDNSVLGTGFLTMSALAGKDGGISDASGFRGSGETETYIKKRKWIHANSDAMRLDSEPHFSNSRSNMPSLNGRIVYPENYRSVIEDGFERMYRFLLFNKNELMDTKGPLKKLRKSSVRVILRPSNIYGLFIVRMLNPDNQKIGWEASLVMEHLTGVFQYSEKQPEVWKAIREEQKALENMDIPHFTVPAPEGMLSDRISRLCEDDMKRQLSTIRMVLSAFENDGIRFEEYTADQSGKMKSNLEKAAEIIAEQILRQSKTSPEGLIWNAPEFHHLKAEDSELSPDLYGGTFGIALFFAALSRVLKNGKFELLARQICAPVIRSIESGTMDKSLRENGIGICNGIGSFIYALLMVGRMLDDPLYIEKAYILGSQIRSTMILSDRRLDVEGGTAGLLMALTALYQVTKQNGIFEMALMCARHLLETSHVESDTRGWENAERLMLAGYSHGASGIGLSLLRFYKITDDQKYLEAGKQAFRYERTLFSEEKRNWPVLTKRPDGTADNSVFMTSWCHGAPGIGLARIASLDITHDDGILSDIGHALHTTAKCGLTPIDTLCCGNIGRADILLTAGAILNKENLVREAESLVFRVLERARTSGFFGLQLENWENRCFQTGFFNGLSGIGYTLLRMAHPEKLDSILLFS